MITFTVLTWNVENLFRPGEGDAAPDATTYADKLTLLAQVIQAKDPDIVALQEVGGNEPPFDLQQKLGGAYPHRVLSSYPDGRGIRVAFLSKFAVAERADMIDFPPGPALDIHDVDANGTSVPLTRMTRGALHIRVAKDGHELDIVTAHLKSKLLSFRRPWGTSFTPRDEMERAQVAGIALLRRTAEAVALRVWANSFLEGNQTAPLIILGDFNDVPEAQTSLILAGPPGSEIGTRGFDDPDAGDDARLFNLAPLIPEDQRYSRVHRGRKELLDQIFASEELLPRQNNNKRRCPTVASHTNFAAPGANLLSIGENPGVRTAEAAPDHAPVTAVFKL